MNHHVSIRHEIAARNAIFFWEHADRPLESWVTINKDEGYHNPRHHPYTLIWNTLSITIYHLKWFKFLSSAISIFVIHIKIDLKWLIL